MQLDLAQHDVTVSAADDRCMRSDDGSMSTDRSAATMHNRKSGQSPRRHRKYDGQQPSSSVNYHGTDIYQAAADGNLPLCVLLWGMATAKRINLMDPDSHGNTPMHYAALADLPEVMGFFLKQGRHRNNQENRLLDSRNALGETPLLRASTVGKIPSLKFLLDEGADPFCSDHLGNTIFINLARYGRIWGLHYVYSTLCDKYGYERASQLLVASDVSDNNALDWAADSGEVNIIEYLIRRNINPLRTNYNGRSALHIAAKYSRLDAALFLVKCGCDPFQQSRDNESPMSVAVASNNREIIAAMGWKGNLGKLRHTQLSQRSSSTRIRAASKDLGSLVGIPGGHETSGQSELESGYANTERKNILESSLPPGATFAVVGNESTAAPATAATATAISSPSLLRDPDPGLSLYTINKQGSRRPHAIFRLKPSRIGYAVFYGLVVVAYWILAICVRFYVWAILVVLSVLLFRHIEKKYQAAEAERQSRHTHTATGRSRFQDLILAPEKFLGVYMGMTTTCLLYWLCSLRMGVKAEFYSCEDTEGPGSLYFENLKNQNLALPPLGIEFLDIGGLSASTDDIGLFWAVMISLVLAGLAWGQLTWFSTDPGAIYSRYEDFDMIMDQCLTTLAPAPGQLYCRTSMVKKPLRSKYCIQTGFVIARMDHFCVWLNNSVGYGNHRTFIVFLFFQFVATSLYSAMLIRALYREMGVNATACWALSHLFDRLYFFPTVLCAALLTISITIGALLIDQNYNILKNITTNERLNRARYPWMTDHLGNPFNHFDRGYLSNFLEFWCAPGYRKNYYNEFSDLPSAKATEPLEKSPFLSGYATRRDSVDSNMSGFDPYRSRSNTFSPPVSNIYQSDSASVGDTEQPPQSFPRFRQLPTYPLSPMTKSYSYDQSGLISPSDLYVQDDPSPIGGQNNGFSILTRAQEAHLQFEARVQQAIELSHTSADTRTDERFQGQGPISPGPPPDGVSTHWGQYRDISRDSMRVATSDVPRPVRIGRTDESTSAPPLYPQLSPDITDAQQNFATHGTGVNQPRSSSFLSIDTSTGPDMHVHSTAPVRRFSPGSAGGKSYERSVPQIQRPSSTGGYLPHQERRQFRSHTLDGPSSFGPQGVAMPAQLRPVDGRAHRSVDLSKMDDD